MQIINNGWGNGWQLLRQTISVDVESLASWRSIKRHFIVVVVNHNNNVSLVGHSRNVSTIAEMSLHKAMRKVEYRCIYTTQLIN